VTNPATQLRPKSLFRVVYRDGAAVITSATSSLQAERNAVSKRPGVVKEIIFLKRNGQ